MRFFLKAKAWHLFVFLFGGMALAQYLFAAQMGPHGEPQAPPWQVMVPMFVWAACFLGWLWALGTELTKKVPEELRMGTGFFKFGLVYGFVYSLVGFNVLTTMASADPPGPWLLVIVPFHFLAMFCMFYALYFVSKTLRMAETWQKTTFYDYSGAFFLLWFFPIGVWVIQPRVNRMFSDEDTQSSAQPAPSRDAAEEPRR